MKTQITKKERNFSKNFLSKTVGFTLVELIIVITILAILATIAFISFKNYSWNARDGNRVATLKNIEKWLELYFVKTWEFPSPDGNILTGSMSWTQIMYSWEIWDNISSAIKLNKLAFDPTLGKNYKYWITANKQEYNLGGIWESDSLSQNIIPTTYANSYYWQVVGNYRWYIKYSTGNLYYLTNVPSLIYTYSGSVSDLYNEKDNVHFVIKKWENIPYNIPGKINSKTPDNVIKRKTWKSNAKFENIDISEVVNAKTSEKKKEEIAKLLWKDKDILESFWTDDKDILENIVNGTPQTILNNSSSSSSSSSGWGNPENPIDSKLSWNCENLPENAKYFNNWDNYSINKAPIGTSLFASFALNPSENTCEFKCNDNYNFVTNQCVLTNYTITFESNGWTSIQNQIVSHNWLLIKPNNPTKSEYIFDGWYKEAQFTTLWNFNTDVVNANITLYAKWSDNTTPISFFEYSVIDNNITITKYKYSQISPKNVKVPSEIEGKKVISIANNAFNWEWTCSDCLEWDQAQLTSLILPETLETIWDTAFYYNKLTVVVIPDSVKSIWRYAFAENHWIVSVTIWRNITTILEKAFFINNISTIIFRSDNSTSIWLDVFNWQNSTKIFWLSNINQNVYWTWKVLWNTWTKQ